MSSVAQFTSSSLWLASHVHAALIGSALSVQNSAQCGRAGGARAAVCDLFSYDSLEAETERVTQAVYAPYTSLMLWSAAMPGDSEPFACWRCVVFLAILVCVCLRTQCVCVCRFASVCALTTRPRQSLERLSAPLLALFQGLDAPRQVPVDVSFCETVWRRARARALSVAHTANTRGNLALRSVPY